MKTKDDDGTFYCGLMGPYTLGCIVNFKENNEKLASELLEYIVTYD